MVLDIKNRTENWGTVNKLYGPIAPEVIGSVMKALGQPPGTLADIELFWRGYRDHCYDQNITARTVNLSRLLDRFRSLFPNLRDEVKRFADTNNGSIRLNDPCNYRAEKQDGSGLFANVRNTEFDIVIETENELFIGEVKQTQTFGAKGTLVLPHQLLRQYVTASILLDERGVSKRIIPFIVEEEKVANKNGQVRLMEDLGYLQQGHVFQWSQLIKT